MTVGCLIRSKIDMSGANQLPLEIHDTDCNEAWDAVLALARDRAGRPIFESWIAELRPLEITDTEIVIGAPTEFKRNWVETKYAGLISECVEAAYGSFRQLRFVVSPALKETAASGTRKRKVEVVKPPAAPRQPDEDFFGTVPLNDRFTFETFIIGRSNRMAHAGAVAAAQNPGRQYNPLFLYGGAGLGKTHLMQAVGHAVRSANPNRRVAYLSAETFVTQYVSAIRERKMEDFRARYRHADVLLVDDIQFIADKERTEEEFFHTFNALRDMGRQIIVSSDVAPKELRLDERLRSRFEAGLITDIRPPELETRLAILQNRASQEGTVIPDDVLMYMAELIQSNIRALEGALIKLLAYASVTHSPITQQLAGDVLGNYFSRSPNRDRAITPDDIKRLVARGFDVSVEEINGTSRSKGIVLARQVAMHLMRELTGASLPEIGRAFGGKDHSTVVHACQKVKSLLMNDLDVARHVSKLMEDLRKPD
ncbi:MAG: chromosomal replication initiator protein DnaA [Armatimonadetes bacterium]|jgi:chromosomal replication initiator protein|nr:chromosomal replication initiator protein DnaA [Armatimonadota bacterium]